MFRIRQRISHSSRARGAPRGFTLLEALIASVVLAIVVLAVGSGVSAGRQNSLEAEKLILATVSADDLLSELITIPYASLQSYDGLVQNEGDMTTLDGKQYPSTFWLIGRGVTVQEVLIVEATLGITVRGRRVVVSAFDEHRVLAQLETFIPEPAS